MTKAKRKGPRYVESTAGCWVNLVFDHRRNEDLLPDEVVRDLNAGARAKAEVKRLKAELAEAKLLQAHPAGKKVCR